MPKNKDGKGITKKWRTQFIIRVSGKRVDETSDAILADIYYKEHTESSPNATVTLHEVRSKLLKSSRFSD